MKHHLRWRTSSIAEKLDGRVSETGDRRRRGETQKETRIRRMSTEDAITEISVRYPLCPSIYELHAPQLACSAGGWQFLPVIRGYSHFSRSGPARSVAATLTQEGPGWFTWASLCHPPIHSALLTSFNVACYLRSAWDGIFWHRHQCDDGGFGRDPGRKRPSSISVRSLRLGR
jgi:hypothetical protein